MPEGDTIFRTAAVLRRALAGEIVEALETVAPKVSAAARREEAVGSRIASVEANGKHLFISFATPRRLVLHTHLKMTGAWHVYRPGERWWEPPSDTRVVIRTATVVAPCFHPPIVELLTADELGLHPVVRELGPDIIRDAFDLDEAIRRLRRDEERDIATALLDQRAISGIGNVFKVEALFLARVSPWVRVGDLDDATLRRIVAQARRLIRRNREGGPRRTRPGLDPRDRMWVDERAGRACHVCGTTVRAGWHPAEVRRSWYCPSCQGVDEATVPRSPPLPAGPARHRDRR